MEPSPVDTVSRTPYTKSRRNYKSDGPKKCLHCGRNPPHPHDSCPAGDAKCHRCSKIGHFGAVFLTRPLNTMEESEIQMEPTQDTLTLDSFFLDTVEDIQNSKYWTATIFVNGSAVSFKLDTGTEVTAITEQTLKLLESPNLNQPIRKLRGPNHQPLAVRGSLSANLSHGEHSCTLEIIVVKQFSHTLLGLPHIKDLYLLTIVNNLQTATIRQRFPSLFTGLGALKGEYEICLKPNALPYCLGTARNIPLPIRKNVKETLAQMEEQGVISKVQQPTPWCAGKVVVKKKNGRVHVCVDLKPLNHCVLREHHTLPKIDETLTQLSVATTFSKLDANSGFWQVLLSEGSRLVTTFITPFGHYCYNKLPFGISSAPEHFQ